MPRLVSLLAFTLPLIAQDAFLAEGIRVGEVTPTSAILRVRTSQAPARVPGVYPREERRGRAALPPSGVPMSQLPGAVPGRAAQVRIIYSTKSSLSGARETPWTTTSAANDFAAHFALTHLKPETTYYYAAQITGRPKSAAGSFHTAPLPEKPRPVTFAVVTGMMYRDLDHPDGFRIWDSLRAAKPDFIVFTGDNVYYDNEPPRAVSIDIARYHWQRMFSLPRFLALAAEVPIYWEKDDHDTLSDDCWPGLDPDWMRPMTFAQGQQVFLEQAPLAGQTNRGFRWGSLLEIWLPEGRDFRSPNNAPDGPEKTILGALQKRWLKESVEKSDARFRVIVSETPWVGPDRATKGDNYANPAFATEGAEMRQWAGALKPANLFIATGDRHWQYHSVDPATGLHEFSCGPASNEHAGGSPGLDPSYHKFHAVQGGFLLVTVQPNAASPTITFDFRTPDGRSAYTWSPAVR